MSRAEYQKAYYEAHKEEKKAKRKKQPRTDAARASEEKYWLNKQLLKEINALTFGVHSND